ncbi:MAG: hypothetical protein AABX01_06455 [Candidatus Micrarchaeota archaeon]
MKMHEFWNESVTEKSWEALISLSKEYEFTLIGGWAAYVWAGLHKSKDIDMVIDYNALNLLRANFNLEKNERLHKYEIKMGGFDADIYLPGYSRLAFPLEHLKEYSTVVQGFRVPLPEVLIILKQGAEVERRGSAKGKKDLIDILTLLVHSGFSLEKYKGILEKYKLEKLSDELEKEVLFFNPKDAEYLNLNLNEFAKWKRGFLRELKK